MAEGQPAMHGGGAEQQVSPSKDKQYVGLEYLEDLEDLQAKLELSARLGQQLLDREESFKRELELIHQQLWTTNEQIGSLRTENSNLMEELFKLRKENVRISLNASEQAAIEVTNQEDLTVQQHMQLRICDLEQELHGMRLSKTELQDTIIELRIELEATSRLKFELESRLKRSSYPMSESRSRSFASRTRSIASHPQREDDEGILTPAAGSPPAWPPAYEDDDEYMQKLEADIACLVEDNEMKDAIIEELRIELEWCRSKDHGLGSADRIIEAGEEHSIERSLADELSFVAARSNSSVTHGSRASVLPDNTSSSQEIRGLQQEVQALTNQLSSLQYQNDCLKILMRTKEKRRTSVKGERRPAMLLPDASGPSLVSTKHSPHPIDYASDASCNKSDSVGIGYSYSTNDLGRSPQSVNSRIRSIDELGLHGGGSDASSFHSTTNRKKRTTQNDDRDSHRRPFPLQSPVGVGGINNRTRPDFCSHCGRYFPTESPTKTSASSGLYAAEDKLTDMSESTPPPSRSCLLSMLSWCLCVDMEQTRGHVATDNSLSTPLLQE